MVVEEESFIIPVNRDNVASNSIILQMAENMFYESGGDSTGEVANHMT